MDKTININLGGTLFSIDEDAYRILRDYLQSIDSKFRNAPGGNETIEDIESRIAEIFISKKGVAGVISRENVEEMITIIGKPEDFGQTESSGTYTEYSSYTGSSRRMYRNPDDSIIAGVCGGIGTYLNTDPVWMRIIFTFFAIFGIGFFVYLALWIALPSAVTDQQKKEMYGAEAYRLRMQSGNPYTRPNQTTSRIGNAFNEVFRAVGRVCFIFVRIFLIIFGTCIVLSGFLFLATFIMIFLFKFPGAFSTDIDGASISYIPDFLRYVVTPAFAPWITALITIIVTIPLLALIYGGIRLIFWFRVRDGFVWLGAFILWTVSVAVLSVMLFNEGVSFAENARTSSQQSFTLTSDTLFISAGKSIDSLDYDNEIIIPDDEYSVFVSDKRQEISLGTRMNIMPGEGKELNVGVIRHSSGRNRSDAMEKAESIKYDYAFSNDTLYLDEYCTIPRGKKWSFDRLRVDVNIPVGKIVYLDKVIDRHYHSNDYYSDYPERDRRFWVMTEEGLEPATPEKGDKQ